MTNLEIIKRLKTAKDLYDKDTKPGSDKNGGMCHYMKQAFNGDAFTIHGNSVKGNVGGSIEANSIEVGGDVQGDILGVLTYNVKGSSSSVE